MNKTEFIHEIAERASLTLRQAEDAEKVAEQIITELLANGDKLQLVGFGTFELTERAERTGRNPLTGETITIKAAKNVRFKAGKNLKDAVQ